MAKRVERESRETDVSDKGEKKAEIADKEGRKRGKKLGKARERHTNSVMCGLRVEEE